MEQERKMRKGNYFLKAAVAVLAAALLMRLLRERLRFSRSGGTGSDTPEGRQRQTREAPTMEGEERRDQKEGRHEGIAEHEDELRVQRSEEELAAGTREREAGEVRVSKNVRTDRERIEVPTRHEEVSVERVPVSGEAASEAEIGEDEVVVPLTEEEVVVEKRPVVKEEVRIKKDVVEDTEVVEEDVRREEIDVEDDTERRGV
jgi:uncharacterized protein (TIGR02271 family)